MADGPLTRYKPQWGRSVNLKTPFVRQTQQLVRLQFPEPRDITVYLHGATYESSAIATRYKVSAGIGGVALHDEEVPCPVVGTVRHWVCDAINVEALIDAQSTAGRTYRFAATAGIGKPSESIEVAGRVSDLNALPNMRAPVTDFGLSDIQQYAWFRVPSWATHARIQLVNATTAPFAPAQILVSQVQANNTFIGDGLSIASMDEFVPLDTRAWWLRVENFAWVTPYRLPVIVTFKKWS